MVWSWSGVIVSIVSLSLLGRVRGDVMSLWPWPHSIDQGLAYDFLEVHPNQFEVILADNNATEGSEIVREAVQRYFSGPKRFVFEHSTRLVDRHQFATCVGQLTTLTIRVSDSAALDDVSEFMDESYVLNVRKSGLAFLVASSPVGVVRGLETFSQLVDFSYRSNVTGDSVFEITHVPISIRDAPFFRYRGLMIDTARHFLPLRLILDNLDAMAANKLNVLHWHMTDSQSFSFKSKKIPALSEMGAFSPQQVYTHKDVRKVIREAWLRGIRVIPEFDTPGHTQSWTRARPDAFPRCPVVSEPLDPANPESLNLVRELYEEVLQLFPDKTVHVGNDEVDASCLISDDRYVEVMLVEGPWGLIDSLLKLREQIVRVVTDQGRKVIVWQEAFNDDVTLDPKQTIVDIWKGPDNITALMASKQGFEIIHASCWYLDYLHTTWRDFYFCDPLFWRNEASSEMISKVIGGHASMWGEKVDASVFMTTVWPRTSGMAERLWSYRTSDPYRDWALGLRFRRFRCRMLARGFPSAPIEPGHCPIEAHYREVHRLF